MSMPTTDNPPAKSSGTRHLRILMCRPNHFDVVYAINPWMDPTTPVDADLAMKQWEGLRETYLSHGYEVQVVDDEPGLPDMVFAANAGVAIGDGALISRFTYPERQGESIAYAKWFSENGFGTVTEAFDANEGEGDILHVGELLLAGTGFRTSLTAHQEVREFFDKQVISLTLVDPRFYHLDTAMFVVDERTIAYFPPAFSTESQAILQQLFPDAIIATDADATVLGLNAISDGHNVFLTAAATGMIAALRERGFNPVGIELTELLKAGGSVKCCTLELH
jgi:N-dimethylarginine dimethylaminohydrolase